MPADSPFSCRWPYNRNVANPSRDRLSLLRRIGVRYQTVTQRVAIRGLGMTITRVADPDLVLDAVAAEEDRLEKISGRRSDSDQLHLPYWAELWESSLGLGQWLCRGDACVAAKVLDLGCGMGLAGAVAARLGSRVLFADMEPAALLFARLNSLSDRSRVRTRRLDWRSQKLGERFDLILGADILYERKQWDHLEPFWREHLAAEGRVMLAEPGRQTGDLFMDWIRERGWELEQFDEPVPRRANPIRIFQLTPANWG
jgi:predicted nicotinamide N-methyase